MLNKILKYKEGIIMFAVVTLVVSTIVYNIINRIVNDIRQLLSKYQGERHLFVDGEEVNPYRSSGGMG